MLMAQAAQQYRPEDRQRFYEYVQSEPMAAAQLRAPLFEDKVVDFLFDKAEVTEREVTREELQAAIEAEEGSGGHVHGPDCDHDHEPAAKKKKAPAKKAAAKPAEDEAAPVEEKPAAKKSAAKKAAPKAEAAEAPAEKAPAKKSATKKAPAKG